MVHHTRSRAGSRFALAVTVSIFAGAGCDAPPSDGGLTEVKSALASHMGGGFALSRNGSVLNVFALDTNGRIVEKTSNSGGGSFAGTWSLLPPAPAGHSFSGLMASVSWSAGRNDVFVADQDQNTGTIWHAFANSNGVFFGWEPIGNIPNARKLVVTSSGPNNLDIFAMYHLDPSGNPLGITQIKYLNGWLAPMPMTGLLQNSIVNDFSAVSWGPGRIDLVVWDRDFDVDHYWTNDAGYNWNGIEFLGRINAGGLAMSSSALGYLDITGLSNVSANHDVYTNGVGWSGFTTQQLPTAAPNIDPIEGQLPIGYPQAAYRPGRIDVLVGMTLSDDTVAPWNAWLTNGVWQGGQTF